MNRTRAIPILALAFLAALPTRAQWTQALSPDFPRTPKIFALAVVGGKVFAGFESGVFRSSDQGGYWTQVNAGLGTSPAALDFTTDGSTLYVGTVDAGVFKSTDLGESWTAAGLPGEYVSALAAADGRLYAGTCCDGLHISNDGGLTWRKAGIDGGYLAAISAQGGIVYAGTQNGYFRSADRGENWERLHIGMGAADSASGAFAAFGGAVFAGTHGGLYRSLDSGAHWTPAGMSDGGISALAAGAGGLFAGTGNGVFRSVDTGSSWLRVDSGLERPSVTCLTFSGGDAFVGVVGQGVWRRPVAEMGATALGGGVRKPADRRSGGRAFPDGSGMGFVSGGPESLSEARDACGRKSFSGL